MLVTSITLAERYDYLNDKFRAAFEFLRNNDLESLPLGNTPICGEEVYANVQEYTTLSNEQAPFESHRNYFDLQYVVSGKELFGYTPVDKCVANVLYDAERDLVFYSEPKEYGQIILESGQFAIVSPEDAHAPRRCTSEGPCAVRKVVIKIRV